MKDQATNYLTVDTYIALPMIKSYNIVEKAWDSSKGFTVQGHKTVFLLSSSSSRFYFKLAPQNRYFWSKVKTPRFHEYDQLQKGYNFVKYVLSNYNLQAEPILSLIWYPPTPDLKSAIA